MHRGMIVLGLPAILDSSRDTPRAAWRPLVAVLASRVSCSDSTSRRAPGGDFFFSVSCRGSAVGQMASGCKRGRRGMRLGDHGSGKRPNTRARAANKDSWAWLVHGTMYRLDKQCNQRRGGAGLVHGVNTTYASTYREVMRHQIDKAGSQD